MFATASSFAIHLCGGKTLEEYEEVEEQLERANDKISKLKSSTKELKLKEQTTKNLLSEEEAARKTKESELESKQSELASKDAQLASEEAQRKAQEATLKSLKAKSNVASALSKIKGLRVQALSDDITKRKEAQDDLQGQVKLLEQALEAMEQQMKMEREFHVVQLTRVHANTIERFENTVERREGWGGVVTSTLYFF